jgi:hypothetical protein
MACFRKLQGFRSHSELMAGSLLVRKGPIPTVSRGGRDAALNGCEQSFFDVIRA